MVLVPSETPVISPFALIVATDGLDELQLPPFVLLVTIIFEEAQSSVRPVIGCTVGKGLTVISFVVVVVPHAFVVT